MVTLTLCWFVTLFVHAQQSPSSTSLADAEATAFVCPMHPDYTLDIAGTCPRCGMALVRGAPFDVRDYGLQLTTEPAVVQAGKPARWRFRVFHPAIRAAAGPALCGLDPPCATASGRPRAC